MVIQRWQSLLLLIAVAVMACFTFISLGQVSTVDYVFNFTTLGFYQEGELTSGQSPIVVHTWYFFILSLTTVVLLFIDIFLFKNLTLQKKIALIGLLFIIADATVGGLLGYCSIEGGQIGWSSVALCPAIALLATILAYNRMQSDHNKLKSMDRIR